MRTLKTLSAMLLAASFLVACGGGSSDATPPTPTQPTGNAFQGNWTANFTGADSGSCANIAIDAAGNMAGSCTSIGLGGASFGVSGKVTSSGSAQFGSGGSTTGASFIGTITASSGSGTWVNAGTSGTWAMSKK